jgi:hypothetical protein
MTMGRVKMMAAAALSLVATVSLPHAASADTYAWVLFGTNTLGDLDLSTTHGANYSAQTLANGVVGLGELNNEASDLYGLSAAGELYGINGLNGAETPLGGGSGITFIDFGSTATGLFGIATNGDLYDINQANGAATELATFGSGTLTARNDGMGLSTGSTTLFFSNMVSSSVEDLYSVDTTTGALTLVGSMSTTNGKTGGLLVGGMADIAGALWGGANNGGNGSHQSSYTIPTSCSGSCAVAYNADIDPNNKHAVTGMALGEFSSAPPVVPEPGDWVLMLAGVGAVGGMMRLRRRSPIQA